MSNPSINSPVASIQSNAIRGDARNNLMVSSIVGRYVCDSRTLNIFIGSRHQTSPLVEAFEPFSQFTFTETPLVTDFESRYLFALDQTQNGSAAQSQPVSGLLDCQQTHRGNIVFHWANRLSNANAIAPLSVAARFLDKAGALLSSHYAKF